MGDKLTVLVRLCEFYRFTGRDALPDFFARKIAHLFSKLRKIYCLCQKNGVQYYHKKTAGGRLFL